jgi:purine-nucleoside phosphorylase
MPISQPEDLISAGTLLEEAVAILGEPVRGRNARTALILGSGLGFFADNLSDRVVLPYTEIPGFPVPRVSGHAGQLVFGRMGSTDLVVMQGRGHVYEGFSLQQLAHPVRVLKSLGIERLLITNAAGSVNKTYEPGDLMALSDHINMVMRNALIGPNNDSMGTRFPDAARLYSPTLLQKAQAFAQSEGWKLHEGTYMFLTGPCYETPAEIRMARSMGADVVGMSTFPEALVAGHAGMEVFALSYVSNYGAGVKPEKIDHSQVTNMNPVTRTRILRLLGHLVESTE